MNPTPDSTPTPAAEAGVSVSEPSACPFPWDGPPQQQAEVVRALRRVVDPEVALTIVDLGLVYGVAVTGSADEPLLQLRLTMTSAACPVTGLIVDEVETELDRVLPESWRIQVMLVWEPPWSPERMSESARRFMA